MPGSQLYGAVKLGGLLVGEQTVIVFNPFWGVSAL